MPHSRGGNCNALLSCVRDVACNVSTIIFMPFFFLTGVETLHATSLHGKNFLGEVCAGIASLVPSVFGFRSFLGSIRSETLHATSLHGINFLGGICAGIASLVPSVFGFRSFLGCVGRDVACNVSTREKFSVRYARELRLWFCPFLGSVGRDVACNVSTREKFSVGYARELRLWFRSFLGSVRFWVPLVETLHATSLHGIIFSVVQRQFDDKRRACSQD